MKKSFLMFEQDLFMLIRDDSEGSEVVGSDQRP